MKNNKISMERLAQICGVSQGTVDRALNNRAGISEKTKQHIINTAREYGYRPNRRGEALNSGKSGLIGIIVFDLYNEYFSELVMLLERELRRRGYYSLVMFSDKNKKTERECIEAMYSAGVDGIILCPINDGGEFYEYLSSWRVPVLNIGNKIDGVKYIGIDNFSAMRDLTDYVIDMGYRRLIYYTVDMSEADCNIYAQKMRYMGFKSAAGVREDICCVVVTDEAELKKEVTEGCAVIASTDFYALRIMFSKDMKNAFVAGFDDIPSLYKYNIPLTSVSHDKLQLAKKAVDYILNGGDGADEYVSHSIKKL